MARTDRTHENAMDTPNDEALRSTGDARRIVDDREDDSPPVQPSLGDPENAPGSTSRERE